MALPPFNAIRRQRADSRNSPRMTYDILARCGLRVLIKLEYLDMLELARRSAPWPWPRAKELRMSEAEPHGGADFRLKLQGYVTRMSPQGPAPLILNSQRACPSCLGNCLGNSEVIWGLLNA